MPAAGHSIRRLSGEPLVFLLWSTYRQWSIHLSRPCIAAARPCAKGPECRDTAGVRCGRCSVLLYLGSSQASGCRTGTHTCPGLKSFHPAPPMQTWTSLTTLVPA